MLLFQKTAGLSIFNTFIIYQMYIPQNSFYQEEPDEKKCRGNKQHDIFLVEFQRALQDEALRLTNADSLRLTERALLVFHIIL